MKVHFFLINKSFILLSFLILLFNSCQKAEDFQNLDLLLNKEWKLVKVVQGTSDITKACDIDNTLKFIDTKIYEISFGDNFCDEVTEKKTTSLSWKFKNEFSQVRLKSKLKTDKSIFNFFAYWDIIELTENTLILRDGTAEENDMIPIVKEYNF